MRFFSPDYQPVSSWSSGGRPLPYVPFKASPEDKEREKNGELESFVPFFRDALAQADRRRSSGRRSQSEKIRAPILLISGTDEPDLAGRAVLRDDRGPTEERPGFLRGQASQHRGRRHSSCIPFLVTANRGLLIRRRSSGGSPPADARGGYRCGSETMAFLHRHLDR